MLVDYNSENRNRWYVVARVTDDVPLNLCGTMFIVGDGCVMAWHDSPGAAARDRDALAACLPGVHFRVTAWLPGVFGDRSDAYLLLGAKAGTCPKA